MTFVIVLIVLILVVSMAFLGDFNRNRYRSRYYMGYYTKEGLRNYQRDYPNKKIKDLKNEIEEVANRLVDNQNCNRYTENLRERASEDESLQMLNNEFVDNVDILKYKDKKLQAKVDYLVDDNKYSLIFDMITVSTGRVFLKKYKLLQDRMFRVEN